MPVTPSLVRCQEHFYRVIDSRFDSFCECFECFTGLHDTESNRAEEMLRGALAHNQGGGGATLQLRKITGISLCRIGTLLSHTLEVDPPGGPNALPPRY